MWAMSNLETLVFVALLPNFADQLPDLVADKSRDAALGRFVSASSSSDVMKAIGVAAHCCIRGR
ncbi:hypothetical protein [Bradyrhizobium sp. Leo121]|uniref:hypothetical protein n=1 Tax=Bradyrhizobium sp. Leo121 TaxID=1571195 RepID=UPI00102A2AAD|nr:hypothetical protein [Bradyrhizobium sp. Leo121]RZN15253.1 hypothetical protein CWO90_41815 [Bradyrhizobium sp. Leo121]